MKKFDTYMVNKIFTVPYLDRMISEDSIPDTFFECVRRYVKTDDATIGEAISERYYCFCGGILHGVFFSKRFNRKKQKK